MEHSYPKQNTVKCDRMDNGEKRLRRKSLNLNKWVELKTMNIIIVMYLSVIVLISVGLQINKKEHETIED